MTKTEEAKIRRILEIDNDQPIYPKIEDLISQRNVLFDLLDKRRLTLLYKSKKTNAEIQEFNRLQDILAKIISKVSPQSSYSFLEALHRQQT